MSGSKGYIKDVIQILNAGGWVRFTHRTCCPELVAPSGKMSVLLDGRTYQGFLINKKLQRTLVRSSVGSVEKNNLVIEWRKVK